MANFDEKKSLKMQKKWSRRRLIVASLAVSASAIAKTSPHKVERVLFICQFGTAKSAIAREVFRRRALERGITTTAFSRGITLADHISPPLRKILSAEGIDPGADAAQVLSPADLQHADIVVAFTPLPAAAKLADLRDWSDMLSFNDDYSNARPMLNKRIDDLLDSIAKRRR